MRRQWQDAESKLMGLSLGLDVLEKLAEKGTVERLLDRQDR